MEVWQSGLLHRTQNLAGKALRSHAPVGSNPTTSVLFMQREGRLRFILTCGYEVH
jgi:hypothetical protein